MQFRAREELVAGINSLTAPPTDRGTVCLVVVRPETNARHLADVGRVTAREGLEGDRWSKSGRPNPQNQLTVMRADVAKVFANGQPLELFGDNLLVDLDLSETNLPPGTRVSVGTAECEVTPLPHTGCGKFAARVGQDARLLTGEPEFADQRLRGIHFQVIQDGEIRPGDPIRVLSRPGGV